MFKQTILFRKKFIFSDLIPLLISDYKPTLLLNDLQDKQYLEECKKYIEPSTNKNMLHFVFRNQNYKTYKTYTEIAKKISTQENIYFRDNDGNMPMYYAYRNKDLCYIDYLLSNNITSIDKIIQEHKSYVFDMKKRVKINQKYNINFNIDDFILSLEYNEPGYIHENLLNDNYLKQCKEYIEPSSNNTLLHMILNNYNYNYLNQDIIKRIITTNNITHKNIYDITPIHIMMENMTLYSKILSYLDNLIAESKLEIKKIPLDNHIISCLRRDDNPNDNIMLNIVEKYFDTNVIIL